LLRCMSPFLALNRQGHSQPLQWPELSEQETRDGGSIAQFGFGPSFDPCLGQFEAEWIRNKWSDEGGVTPSRDQFLTVTTGNLLTVRFIPLPDTNEESRTELTHGGSPLSRAA
jgi:hypothetical protein